MKDRYFFLIIGTVIVLGMLSIYAFTKWMLEPLEQPAGQWRYKVQTEIQWLGIPCDSFSVATDGRCATYYQNGQVAGRVCGEFTISPWR